MIKTLTRQGNSSALIIDRTLLDLLGIDNETPLKLSVEGRRLIVEPAEPDDRAERVRKIVRKTGAKNAELFRRLAR